MGFMQSYKKLDNLCRDMNGVGVTGYIEEMESLYNGERRVDGWRDDYYTLKHYRHIRNQIAHEAYASEETLCRPEDEKWVESFYSRIMHQADPIYLYRKSGQTKNADGRRSYQSPSSGLNKRSSAAQHYSAGKGSYKKGDSLGFGTIVFFAAIIVIFAIVIFR